ncbi:MAG: diaminopimelate epimerase, partial [Chloroflexi bacterium]|nr:diaminopimelate epimerase [Chloroflexota bacterium]
MAFEKWHGAGNDFVIVDDRGETGGLGRLDLGGFARQVCDRHFGVGADGLLIAVAGEGVAVAMRMFNPDGSEAEMCGNGLRCFAR